MTKRKELIKDRISRKEILAYIIVGVSILTILFGYWDGLQGFRQAMIDRYGFWRGLLGLY